MTGYIVEILNPLGWRRPNVVHYRYADALAHANDRLADLPVRAVRILSFAVNEAPVFRSERHDSQSSESTP